MTDPLLPLAELPGVAEAVATARSAIADVHRHPSNRRGWPATAAEASVRAARASAAIAGGSTKLPTDGGVEDPVLAGALRVAEALGPMLGTWQRAPMQALARLHVLAAADLVGPKEQDSLGRPEFKPGGARRLELLADLLTGGTKIAAPILIAVVYGELLNLAVFPLGNGVVARAAARLTSVATGLDTKGLIVPEVAYLRRESEFFEAQQGFATGEPDAVAHWIILNCQALEAGAREAASIADAATGEAAS
jgi:hypothetical protein